MPNYLHRTTLDYIPSIAPADLPESVLNYIEDPNLSAVIGFPKYYWVINGDAVELANPAQRSAIDAQRLSNRRDTLANEIQRAETILRAFAEVVLDEINALRAEHLLPARTLSQLRDAIRNKLNG